MTGRRVLLALGVGLLGNVSAIAQEASLGGGSDLSAGTVVELPRGAFVPPIHHVFADNREPDPIEVTFRSEAPPGIEVVPERRHFTIAPGASEKDPFSIRVDRQAPPGDHPVTVQLVRSDIAPRPGEVVNIPAIGTTFTIRVSGESARLVARSVSAESGNAVEGTLSLVAIAGSSRSFELARTEGSEVSADVAPGDYEARYLLAGRQLASKRASVQAGERAEVVLEVETISFVLVAARPVKEGDNVVLADLVVSVENHLKPMDGNVVIRARVERDGERIDSPTIDELGGLPSGVTEAKLAYRPRAGFPPGTYRFGFELTTQEFTLTASEEPGFEVGDDAALASWVPVLGISVAAVALAGWALHRRGRRPMS